VLILLVFFRGEVVCSSIFLVFMDQVLDHMQICVEGGDEVLEDHDCDRLERHLDEIAHVH